MCHLVTFAVMFGLANIAAADDDKKPDGREKPSLKVGENRRRSRPANGCRANRSLSSKRARSMSSSSGPPGAGRASPSCRTSPSSHGEFRDARHGRRLPAQDPSNTAEKVAEFVVKRGKKLGYTFAFADNRDTYEAYMKAAGQNGIPCSYVIGKDGKLAFIGHPALLDEVLPKCGGTWTRSKAPGSCQGRCRVR